MARQEEPREDLWAEATALVRRAEFVACRTQAEAEQGEPVVVGFRREGSASVYLSADQAYHLNSRCQLRRAYVDGLLYKAEAGRLISLDRRRTNEGVQLLATPLPEAEQARFLENAFSALTSCGRAIERGEFVSARQVPNDATLAREIAAYLLSLPHPLPVAATPRSG